MIAGHRHENTWDHLSLKAQLQSLRGLNSPVHHMPLLFSSDVMNIGWTLNSGQQRHAIMSFNAAHSPSGMKVKQRRGLVSRQAQRWIE
jgi:hypothetical protein